MEDGDSDHRDGADGTGHYADHHLVYGARPILNNERTDSRNAVGPRFVIAANGAITVWGSYRIDDPLQFFQEASGVLTVHLGVMELERDG